MIMKQSFIIFFFEKKVLFEEIIIESANCNGQILDMLTIFRDLKLNVFLLSFQTC